jgi:tRNA C32,U32 (ribose-2'-O)-methylase TrmJ
MEKDTNTTTQQQQTGRLPAGVGKCLHTTEERIRKHEIAKEEAEDEVKALEKTLNEIKALEDKTPNGSARSELKAFTQRLEQQIEISRDILNEIIQSIEFVKKVQK